jgi:hypothetical protein
MWVEDKYKENITDKWLQRQEQIKKQWPLVWIGNESLVPPDSPPADTPHNRKSRREAHGHDKRNSRVHQLLHQLHTLSHERDLSFIFMSY